MKKQRPFLIWVVLFLFLVLGWQGVVRVWQTAVEWQYLSTFELSASPLYLAASGLIWAAVGLIPAFGLWFRRGWSLTGGRIGVWAAAVSYWVDRLFLTASPSARTNLVFSAVLTAILMFYTLGVFSLPITRQYIKNE